MKIRGYFYCEDNRNLTIDFSTSEDGDDFYRKIELEYWDIEYYSPDILKESDLKKINKGFLVELLEQYLNENELPDPEPL